MLPCTLLAYEQGPKPDFATSIRLGLASDVTADSARVENRLSREQNQVILLSDRKPIGECSLKVPEAK
jgi:hypothetical protein